jgi:hypothetical protein
MPLEEGEVRNESGQRAGEWELELRTAALRRASRRTRDERGQVIALFALGLVGVLAMAAFVVDVGRFYLADRQLQSSSDAVATALADQLENVKAGTETLDRRRRTPPRTAPRPTRRTRAPT